MDSASRRAFGLDSRTVWVEQQLRHQILLPRENLVLGPGEYHPKKVERNISTPSLGRYRGPADHFRSFQSTVSGQSRSPSSSPARAREGSVSPERSDFSTIFQHHDQRNPLDPKTRFTDTPGPYLGPDSPLQYVSNDGPTRVRHTQYFARGAAHSTSDDVPAALPSYDIKYDSLQIRPTPKLGTFPTSARIHIPSKKDQRRIPNDNEGSLYEDNDHFPPRPSTTELSRKTGMSTFQIRCSLVALPKLKTRAPPKLVFDDSSYRKKRLAEPIPLTKKNIDKQAKVDIFSNIASIPRKHRSVEFSNFRHKEQEQHSGPSMS